MRPVSIRRFELLYLASIALGIIGTVSRWDRTMARIAADPNARSVPVGVLIAMVAVGSIVSLALWFPIARLGSNVARWIATVLFGVAVVSLLGAVTGQAFGADLALRIVTVALEGGAILMLFRPDAAPWFGRATSATPDT